MKKSLLLGLPGLYQNWLIGALDSSAFFKFDNEHNFIAASSKVRWFRKLETTRLKITECSNEYHTINLYVKDPNFVWYLYNFLEKTDGVGIHVNTLIDDLSSKAEGTIAFDSLLKHFVDSYNLTQDFDSLYKQNAAIEYFYLLLINQDAEFKKNAEYTLPNMINVEYNDFSDCNVLIDKLNFLPDFDTTHFKKMYQQLEQRNHEYINRHKNFLDKIKSKDSNFDILEIAYLGWLVWNLNPVQLDWFNMDVRKNTLNNHWQEICDLANKCYNKQYDSL